jgi:hypothetical protein
VVDEKRSSSVRPSPRSCCLLDATDEPSNLVAFKVYDMDRDGYISNGELFLVLKMMVGNNLKVRPYPLCMNIFGTLIIYLGSTTAADS